DCRGAGGTYAALMGKPIVLGRHQAAERLALLVNALRLGKLDNDGAVLHIPDRVRFDLDVSDDTLALSVSWAELQAGAPKRPEQRLDDKLVEEEDDRVAAEEAESVDEEDTAAALDARSDRVPVP